MYRSIVVGASYYLPSVEASAFIDGMIVNGDKALDFVFVGSMFLILVFDDASRQVGARHQPANDEPESLLSGAKRKI